MFKLPTEETFNGWKNFEVAIKTNGFFKSFGYSAFITVTSVLAICIFCSMCAWFITRIKNKLTSLIYYLFAFSMVVPFQMVMLTLSKTANRMGLDSPWLIWIIYLGFGAGLAVFMFAGFMKSVPLEIEEASMIDGCNPLQTFFKVVFPILKPTMVSVAILEAMWVWNDYLLPYLVLDRTKEYSTLPILVQAAFTGSYGRQEQGPMFASMLLTIVPIIIIYIAGQKHIIKGVAAGAVKG
jgi:raffinose/stachyose/melibiose transport system permease protein